MKVTDLVRPKEFFRELVDHAAQKTSVKPTPQASEYLVGLLEYFMVSDHLYAFKGTDGKKSMSTLAEMWLTATQVDNAQRVELLKRLGDSSLYVCGFFSQSLKRKLVDVDYYVDMGGTAYRSLAGYTHGKSVSEVYEEFSANFSDFVEMLFVISQSAHVAPQPDVLNLFEHVLQRDSLGAKQELVRQGILAPHDLKKVSQ